jgi:predicted dehydrogenase
MFMEQMKHFVSVVRGEIEPACPLDDGIRVMKLISAVQQSGKTRQMIDL